MVTAAEDGCIKFWPMEGIASMKKYVFHLKAVNNFSLDRLKI